MLLKTLCYIVYGLRYLPEPDDDDDALDLDFKF